MAQLKRSLLSALLILLLLPMMVSAASFPADREGGVATFWHSLLRPLFEVFRADEGSPVLLKSGPEMDPNGRPKPVGTTVTVPGNTTDSGPEMDPNG